MGHQLTIADLHAMNGEPRVLDFKLAEALEFDRPRVIRDLIKRNLDELRQHGEIISSIGTGDDDDDDPKPPHGAAVSPRRRGPQGLDYWLNEAQAVLICMFSRTAKAAEARTEIIRVFLAYRRGELSRAFEDPASDAGQRWRGAPNQEQLRLLTECRLIFGAARARILWRQLDLPSLPDGETTPDDDARACLRFLLEHPSRGNTDAIGALLDHALDGDEHPRLNLLSDGIRISSEGPLRGFYVPANHEHMLAMFAGTPWAGKGYIRALRRLPGAVAGEIKKFGHRSHRTVFLPIDLLDTDATGPALN
jgi:hypothetical protein